MDRNQKSDVIVVQYVARVCPILVVSTSRREKQWTKCTKHSFFLNQQQQASPTTTTTWTVLLLMILSYFCKESIFYQPYGRMHHFDVIPLYERKQPAFLSL
jgi:hypothetical protein